MYKKTHISTFSLIYALGHILNDFMHNTRVYQTHSRSPKTRKFTLLESERFCYGRHLCSSTSRDQRLALIDNRGKFKTRESLSFINVGHANTTIVGEKCHFNQWLAGEGLGKPLVLFLFIPGGPILVKQNQGEKMNFNPGCTHFSTPVSSCPPGGMGTSLAFIFTLILFIWLIN